MRNKRFINKTGYTPGTKTANNPVNIIPSQDITMRNVPYPLRATPLDEYGNPIGQSSVMMPNQDYFFENAAFVEERPLTEMQMGGEYDYNPYPYFEGNNGTSPYYPNIPTLGNVSTPRISNYSSANFDTIRRQAESNMQQNNNGVNFNTNEEDIYNNQKPIYQFSNPYGGQDFGTSLFNLGQSVENGDSMGIATFGANALLKGTKSFLQGYGAGNRKNENMRSFYDNFRTNMTGNSTYLQDGGTPQLNQGQQDQQQQVMQQVAEALQQGATPEQIVQKLVEIGIEQQQAVQMVQFVMQQMQEGNPNEQEQTQEGEEQVMQQGGLIPPNFTGGYGAYNQTTSFGTVSRKQMTPQEKAYVISKTGMKDNQFNDNLPVVEKYLTQFRSGTEPIGSPQADKNNAFTLSDNGRNNAGVYNPKTDRFDYVIYDDKGNPIYQEGGTQEDIVDQITQALQSGADPQQILQQLVQSGMDEAQATELIQGILQQGSPEAPQFQEGGVMNQKEQASVNAGIAIAPIPEEKSNAEIEKGEYILDSKGIRKALGETHEKDGTPVNLEPNTKVLSDHLKVGDKAKELSEKLGVKIKPTFTYAKVLDIYNKESGIDEINDEIVKLTAQLEKEQNGKDETTSDLNIEFLIKKIKEETDEKKPIEKEQQLMFNTLFDLQEQSKSGDEEKDSDYMQDGGKMLKEISEKYNIPLENLMKAVPKYQAGGTANISVNNTNSIFTNQPAATDWLPYTPIENATNPLWVGEAYDTQWVPLVEKSLSTPEGAKKIEDWLLSNKQYGDNIGYQLKGLTGQARVDRIKQLATDKKPGTFHDAFLQAVQETAPIQLNEVVITPQKKVVNPVQEFTNKGGQETTMAALDMPTRIPNMPTWNPSLKVSTRLNTIDPALISPEQQLTETDRAVLAAQQDLSNLSPTQRALANIGLTAQQISSNNKIISDTNRFNSQATNQADVYNAKVGDQEQMAENQNALSYEARTLTGLGRFENDLNNMYNQQFRDQTEKWRNIQIYNANNALNPDVQFDGNSYKVYTPTLSDLNLNFVNKPSDEVKKKTPTKKKMGGRFKK